MNALIVIDMQNDFLDGALANKDAQALVPGIVKRIEEFDGIILATRDTHKEDYLQSPEGERLPVVHCVKDTHGWQIENTIAAALKKRNATLLDKPTFGYLGWGILTFADEVELVGTCTDICVVSNALLIKTMFPEINVVINAALCAGTTKENHEAALKVLKNCLMEIR